MNYILAENISKTFGDRILFENVNLGVNKGQKIAIVAQNGMGKSTLLRILTGNEPSDTGKVFIHKGITIGYLDQAPDLNENSTVLESIFLIDNPETQAIRQYESALELQETTPSEINQKLLNLAMEQMHSRNAWDYETRIKQILTRFNIKNLHQKVKYLSGGERKRIALASVLMQEPELLILDEPTNHLDLEMVEWLEEHLRKLNATLLLVTHDRYFLDRVCNEIIEIERSETNRYRGNYTYYLEKKAELEFNLKQETDKARKLMGSELEWLRTQPKARGTKAKSRIDAYDAIEAKANRKIKEDSANFDDIKTQRIGGKTLEIKDISKSYDTFKILEHFSYNFKRIEKVGIIGQNGIGKSTLLNLLVGIEKPDKGHISAGQTVVFGYYHQNGINLKEDMRVIEVVREIAEVLPLDKGKTLSAAQLLDHFNFPYSSHTKYVSTLSGGERRRLYLLTVLMKNPNFLILDEPTNDLDLITLNVLEDFLTKFNGCVVIVSHDRYFMDKLVDHVFVFEGNGVVRDFPGNYTEYREWKTEFDKLAKEQKKEQKPDNSTNDKNKNLNEKTKLSYKDKRQLETIERDLPILEMEKKELENKLSQADLSHNDLLKFSNRLGEIATLIEEKSNKWLELSELDG